MKAKINFKALLVNILLFEVPSLDLLYQKYKDFNRGRFRIFIVLFLVEDYLFYSIFPDQ